MRAHQKKCSNTSNHVVQWIGWLFWQTSLASQKVLLMWNSLNMKLFKRLLSWMNLNCMVVNWRYVLSIPVIYEVQNHLVSKFPLKSFHYIGSYDDLLLYISRFFPRGPMFLEWNNIAPGVSILTQLIASGGRTLLLTFILLMDMGMLLTRIWFALIYYIKFC